MNTKLYLKITAMLLGIAVLSLGLTALLRGITPKTEDDGLRIVTSFYPVYIAAQNVAQNIDGVTVVNMVTTQGGCLHDYQMSPRERALLEGADVFVMNGANAEPFLTAALAQLPDLTTVDLSAGQRLLDSGHVHDHEHEHEHEGEATDDMTVNGHLWVSPLRYRQQVETLCQALMKTDPANADAYRRNTDAYIKKIDAVWTRMQQAAQKFDGVPVVLFHDSLVYLAEDLHLHVAASLNVGEDSGISASELTHAVDALNGVEHALFLYDSQYETVKYRQLQNAVKTVTEISVDTAVGGKASADAWLTAMTAFCEALEAAHG